MEYGSPHDAQLGAERNKVPSSGGVGSSAGSTADLFPKLVTMQRLASGDGFALLAAQAQTLLLAGQLKCRMQSPGSETIVERLLEEQTAFLLSHLALSPRPVIFTHDDIETQQHVCGLAVQVVDHPGIDLAFPVQLGAMGNGYVVFFSVRAVITNDLLVDLHRKALSVMREKFRLRHAGSSQGHNRFHYCQLK